MIRNLLYVITCVLIFTACKNGSNDNIGEGNKVFRYNQTGGLTSLDPAFARNRANIWATSQMYNGLFHLNENLDAEPELVTHWDLDTLTRTVYTFYLEQGVRFHDNECFEGGRGRSMNAKDFVYSFNRVLKTGTGRWIFEDKVLRDPTTGDISDTCFVAVNDSTLRVYLNEPSPIFLQILAMPYAYVVPQEAVEKYKEDFRSNPVGTGPFMLKKWEERNSLLMVKNPSYWKKDENHNPLPYLDAVQVSFIDDKNQEFLTFSDGKLEFVTSITANSRDQILNKDGSIKEKFAGQFQIDKVPYLNTEYIGFHLEGKDEKDNPFLNPDLRRALSYAINREGLVSFLRNSLGTPGNLGIVPEALPSFDKDGLIVQGYKYDEKKAQEALKKAGYPNGEGLPQLTLYTYPSDKEIAEYLQQQWEAIGVTVKIEQNQFSTHQDMVDNGKVQFFRASWLGDYPDAENYLKMFYGDSTNFAPRGINKTHYQNEEFDLLFDIAHEQDNLFDRYDTYKKMDSLMMTEAPVIVLYYDEIIQLKQNYITGFTANAMNDLMLERVDFVNPDEASQNDTGTDSSANQ